MKTYRKLIALITTIACTLFVVAFIGVGEACALAIISYILEKFADDAIIEHEQNQTKHHE